MGAPKGNQFALGNSGRAKKFTSPEELKNAIDIYFEECDNRIRKVYIKSKQEMEDVNDPEPYTIEGLCRVLNVTRETLLHYEKETGYEEYFDTIKEAKMKIQENVVKRALTGDNVSAVSIFVMKNNFGYKDQTEQKMIGDPDNPLSINHKVENHKVIFEKYSDNA